MLLQKLIEVGPFGIVAQRKAAMDLRLVLTLRCEISEKVVEGVNRPRIFLPQLPGALKKIALNLAESLGNGADEIRPADARFFARIAPREEYAVLGNVFGPNFCPQRHATLHV